MAACVTRVDRLLRCSPSSHSTMPVMRRSSAVLPWLCSAMRTCLMALTGSTHQLTLTIKPWCWWRMVLSPWVWVTSYAAPCAPQADGVALHASPVRRFCSSHHSPGASDTGSLLQAVIWLSRLLTAHVWPAPLSLNKQPIPGLANTLIHGRTGRCLALTSKTKARPSGSNCPWLLAAACSGRCTASPWVSSPARPCSGGKVWRCVQALT